MILAGGRRGVFCLLERVLGAVHFHPALWELLYGMISDIHRMEQRELRHGCHTATLSTNHTVFLQYYGAILVGVVALALDWIVRKTCKDIGIELTDMAVNVDNIHLFIRYPLKYFMSYIAKRLKGMRSRELCKAFPPLKEWCNKSLWASACFYGSVGHGWGLLRGTYRIKRFRIQKRDAQALYLSAGFGDFRIGESMRGKATIMNGGS